MVLFIDKCTILVIKIFNDIIDDSRMFFYVKINSLSKVYNSKILDATRYHLWAVFKSNARTSSVNRWFGKSKVRHVEYQIKY